MKFQADAMTMPEIFPIFAHPETVIFNNGFVFDTSAAMPIWIAPLIKVTTKNPKNSAPAFEPSFFSKAQYLSATYFTLVAIINEVPTKIRYFVPLSVIPNQSINKLKISKSKIAKNAPIKMNLANWNTKRNFFPIIYAIHKQTKDKIGRTTGKSQIKADPPMEEFFNK